MIDFGLIDAAWALSPRDPAVPPWVDEPHKLWQQRRMEVYAAQIDSMDQGIGRIVEALRRQGQLDNTLILFLADNGGCAEEITGEWGKAAAQREIGSGDVTPDGRAVRYGNDPDVMPGDESTYQSCGVEWANLSNTPFRMYKHWTHEGGIATPLIVHWPAGLKARGEVRHQCGQLTDIMATVVDVAGVEYPAEHNGRRILPMEGASLVPAFEGRDRDVTLMFEHEGNAAVRRGKWKLVRNFTATTSGRGEFDPPGRRGGWELYDMVADRTELRDLAADHPELVAEMAAAYEAWAARCGVIPRDELLRSAKAWRERHT
jgi:arylsulfatase